jgi:hypothetical protein
LLPAEAFHPTIQARHLLGGVASRSLATFSRLTLVAARSRSNSDSEAPGSTTFFPGPSQAEPARARTCTGPPSSAATWATVMVDPFLVILRTPFIVQST